MLQLIDLFDEFDCQLHFCSTAQPPEGGLLGDKQIPYTQIELNASVFDEFIADLKPDLVVFDRFMTEEQYSWRVREQCSGALRILDTEDLHFLRADRSKTGQLAPEKLLSDTAKRELAAIYRSDLSLIISKAEMGYLTGSYQMPVELLLYLPFLVDDSVSSAHWLAFGSRKDFFFVGNGLHKPNLEAIQQLYRLWPSIKTKLPAANLHIYGAYLPESIMQLNKAQQGFHIHGYVEDLPSKIGQHRLLLAPLSFGAGQKRKIFDAWLAGCNVVTTAVGAEGIARPAEFAGAIAETDPEFVDSAVSLYTNKALWKAAQAKILPTLKKNFSRGEFSQKFKDRLIARSEHPQQLREKNTVGQLLWHHSLQSSKYLSKWIEEKNKNK